MKVMFACLADHASADQRGNKLNVMGIFDHIGARAFPAQHGKMFLVFRLMFEYDDSNKKVPIAIALRDADHRVFATMNAEVGVGALPPGDFATVNHIIELNGAVFAKPGRYHFAVRLGDQEEVQVPFGVSQA